MTSHDPDHSPTDAPSGSALDRVRASVRGVRRQRPSSKADKKAKPKAETRATTDGSSTSGAEQAGPPREGRLRPRVGSDGGSRRGAGTTPAAKPARGSLRPSRRKTGAKDRAKDRAKDGAKGAAKDGARGRSDAPTKRKGFNFELTPKKIKREEVMNFARQTSSFVRAGIPIIDALAIISEDTTDKKLREVLAAISVELRAGSSLTEALMKHSSSFPRYFVSMIRSAELTGQLDEVLDQLARYIDRDVETRRKVKSAMTYPSVIFLMAIGTIIILSVFVLPKFKTFFDSFDAELPWATRTLVAVTNFMTMWGVTGVLIALWLVIFSALVTRRERGKLIRDAIFLRIPKVGPLLRIASIERFCRILAVMVKAGVPLPDALSVASDTTGNRVYRRGIGQIRVAIMRGAGMAGPIADTNLFPAAARQMIRVGESTGTLEEQLAASADFYGRELEYKLKRFTDLFEPAIVALMGLVVGFVAYALVSAMYGIFNQVNA